MPLRSAVAAAVDLAEASQIVEMDEIKASTVRSDHRFVDTMVCLRKHFWKRQSVNLYKFMVQQCRQHAREGSESNQKAEQTLCFRMNYYSMLVILMFSADHRARVLTLKMIPISLFAVRERKKVFSTRLDEI